MKSIRKGTTSQQLLLFSIMAKTEKLSKPKIDRFQKSEEIKLLVSSTIKILSELGIPMEKGSPRQQQRTSMAFLALAGVKRTLNEFKTIISLVPLRSREVLQFWNENFEEKLKDSSYDDVRSENLDELTLAGLAINVGDVAGGARNDSRRKFTLSEEVKALLRSFDTREWDSRLNKFKNDHHSLREELGRKRDLHKIEIILPEGLRYITSDDKHNKLQKKIIEEFIPIFIKAPKILYFGDATKRTLHKEDVILEKLNFFELSHEELPDVIIFDELSEWIFLIEAYHSTGEWNEKRVLKIKKKLPHLSSSLVFVTAFLDRAAFRHKAATIAWETEVWIAEDPEHMIHFNGDKFFGPYQTKENR